MQSKNSQYEENRIRNIQMKFRCTEAEKDTIRKNMKDAGYRYEVDFINDMCCNGFVIKREYPFLQDLKNCAYELSKQGNNVNQIARKVNSGEAFTQYDFEYLRELLEEQGRILRFAFRYFLGD